MWKCQFGYFRVYFVFQIKAKSKSLFIRTMTHFKVLIQFLWWQSLQWPVCRHTGERLARVVRPCTRISLFLISIVTCVSTDSRVSPRLAVFFFFFRFSFCLFLFVCSLLFDLLRATIYFQWSLGVLFALFRFPITHLVWKATGSLILKDSCTQSTGKRNTPLSLLISLNRRCMCWIFKTGKRQLLVYTSNR